MVVEGSKYLFVAVPDPDEIKDSKIKRLSRSHAIKQALESKRRIRQRSGLNFHRACVEKYPNAAVSKPRQRSMLSASPSSSVNEVDLLQILISDSSKLHVWLSQNQMGLGIQPGFSVADELILQNFPSIFRTGLEDTALLNASMLTFTFAATGIMSQECLRYSNRALNSIRAKMDSLERAASEATLAAILLLARIEERLQMPCKVELHMNAVSQLLRICQERNIYLGAEIKRAVFWQDLNSSIVTGVKRIVNHITFTELRWMKSLLAPKIFTLPLGFQRTSYLLSKDFIDILIDINAFQCTRDATDFSVDETPSMAQIDNHQASIQSRLRDLPPGSPFSEICRLAAYLCTSMLRCKMWQDSVFPSNLSSKLLSHVEKISGDPVWGAHPELLIWVLYIGGSAASMEEVRPRYKVLLRLNCISKSRNRRNTWPELVDILSQFIWSDKAFTAPVKSLWVEANVQDVH